MAAGRIVIPNCMPALDANGDPVPGAKLYFYQNETTTLASVYTSAALNVAHANPVVADSSGVFPSIFADQASTYSVAITDSAGAPIVNLKNRDNVSASTFYGEDTVADAEAAAAAAAASEAQAAATLASAVVGVQYFGAVTPAATAAATVEDAYASLGRGGRLHVKQELNVGAAYIENDGVELVGNPVYFDPSDGGGRRPLNYWSRERQIHFGREQLARLYFLLDQGDPVSIGMIGDSNTAGYVGTALEALLEGVSGVTVTNYAVSGTYEDEWLNETGTFATGQANESKNFSAVIAAGHDLIINGYAGTNDAYNGRTAAQFLATKRAALEAIRAEQGGVGAVGILQMTANAQHDGAGSRDSLFLSQVNAGIRQIVQDPGIAAALFDKTAEFPDPFPSFASGGFQYRWIDSAGVHTQYGHTTILAQLIFEWLIPSCYRGSGNMAQVTPASGFTLPASEKMFVGKSGDNIVGGGYVSMTTPASLTLGQHIATLPSGYEPYARAIAEVALFNSGATPQWEYGVPVQILADGTITIGKASTQSPDRIYLVGSWSTLQSI